MEIFVCVKQVPDTETKIIPKSDGSFIEESQIKWIVNPYDEFAIEQALLIKALKPDTTTVTVIRVGQTRDSEALRNAMAMGADEAILVEANDNLDSLSVAQAIKAAIEKSGKKPDLILTGKQAIDDDCLQVPQILAELLNMPSVSVAVAMEFQESQITVKREIEGGALEIYNCPLPAVISCNKGLNTPRYTSLPGILKAKKRPLTTLNLAELGVEAPKILYSNFKLPPEKPAGKKFMALEDKDITGAVQQVVQLLRTEAKVI